jgi:hypothetical protein
LIKYNLEKYKIFNKNGCKKKERKERKEREKRGRGR